VTEPDVALTDYGLALECAVFAWLLFKCEDNGHGIRPWVTLFFAGVAMASLAGGTVHGFFLDETSMGHSIFWSLSLLAIGVTSLSGWVFGARLALSDKLALWVTRAAFGQLVVYTGIVLFLNNAFWIAIADYLPAVLFLLVAFALAARRNRSPRVRLGAWGMVLTLVGSTLQQFRIGIHPDYFNHNALYHLVQALALAFIFMGCRGLHQLKGDLYADTP
jgi:hypothetical protein